MNLVNASANGERGCRFWLTGLDSGSEWDRTGDFEDEDAGDAGRATRTRSCGEMDSSDVGQWQAGVYEEVISIFLEQLCLRIADLGILSAAAAAAHRMIPVLDDISNCTAQPQDGWIPESRKNF